MQKNEISVKQHRTSGFANSYCRQLNGNWLQAAAVAAFMDLRNHKVKLSSYETGMKQGVSLNVVLEGIVCFIGEDLK